MIEVEGSTGYRRTMPLLVWVGSSRLSRLAGRIGDEITGG